MSAPEPSIQDLSPVVPKGVEKEPVALIDTSGSMSWGAAAGSDHPTRWEVVTEAMPTIVATLGAADSQAAKELEAEMAQGGTDEEGGLMTVTFASEATEVGDLNSQNFRELWAKVQIGGGTNLMPGYQLVLDDYMDEFGNVPQTERPALLLLVITDGEASDNEAFEAELAKQHGNTYVAVAIVGHGEGHDNALAQYQALAKTNNHVRVVSFESTTDPDVIAQGMLSLAG
jgi:uncharacterized protein with von Willebrand factor type A (vWA) domain